MEKRISFEIHGEQYVMFVEGVLKKKYYLFKKEDGSVLLNTVTVKIAASTKKESIMYWLERLQSYMRKKIFQKNTEGQQALDCMTQHINTFFVQSAERKTADYGEPCEKCKYIKKCKFDWLSTMHPLLKKSSVKISVVHPEQINTQDSDRKDPDLDKDNVGRCLRCWNIRNR